jgi:hypothetical protein
MSLLSKLLQKRGIEAIEQMTPDEQEVYRAYEYKLRGDPVSIEAIRAFCQSQINLIEDKADGVTPLTMIQQACIHVYKNMMKMIDAPETERILLEQHITQIINSE